VALLSNNPCVYLMHSPLPAENSAVVINEENIWDLWSHSGVADSSSCLSRDDVWLGISRHYKWWQCLDLQGLAIQDTLFELLEAKGRGSTIFQNFEEYLPSDTA